MTASTREASKNGVALSPEARIGQSPVWRDWRVCNSLTLTTSCCCTELDSGIHCAVPIFMQVAKEYTDQLTAQSIIEMLEGFNSFHGLFYYLGAHIAFSEDSEVHYKYIEAAAKIGQLKEVRFW